MLSKFLTAFLLILSLFLISCSHQPLLDKNTENLSKAPEINPNLNYAEYVNSWLEEKVNYVEMNKRLPATTSSYKIIGNCGGYPRVNVKTAAGFCMGQLYDGEGMSMPRWSLALDSSTILVTDMGNWMPYQGSIHMLKKIDGKWKRKTLIDKTMLKDDLARRAIIDRPNQISLSPNGLVLVGGASGIMTFDPNSSNPKSTVKAVIPSLPSSGIHALKSFTFDRDGFIYVNIGSETNVCQKYGAQGENLKKCPESEGKDNVARGLIRRYTPDGKGGFKKDFIIYVAGLRNSVALVYDPVIRFVLEADNGRDSIDRFDKSLVAPELPSEELNILKKGRHYGWPYCFDKNRNNPEWPSINCDNYSAPNELWPAHSAPLSLHIYLGNMFPQNIYKDALLVSLHGYEKYGHRIGVVLRDPDTLAPTGKPLTLVYGWEANGAQLLGSPVGLSAMSDGSILVTEDKSRKVMRLFYDSKEGSGTPVNEGKIKIEPNTNEELLEEKRLRLEEKLRDPNVSSFTKFQAKVIDKQCIMCHGGSAFPGVQLLQYDDEANEDKLIELDKADELLRRVFGISGMSMPPQGFTSDKEKTEARDLLKAWFEEIKRPLPEGI